MMVENGADGFHYGNAKESGGGGGGGGDVKRIVN